MQLSPEGDNLNGFTFSGTDNSLVSTTETVDFCANRFDYHLQLHNRFAPLMTDNSIAQNDSPPRFFPLPQSLKIRSGDVDFGGGFYRKRKKLKKNKKLSVEGKHISEIERVLSNAAKDSNTNKESIVELHQCKNTLQQFYYSNARTNQNKSFELTNKRFRDKLCSKERKYAKDGNKKHLIMFIGYRRYGGTWKKKIHARNTAVCITNEHKTSQTCVYCFSPVINPLQSLVINNKEVLRKCKGAFQCIHSSCVSVVEKKPVQSRDRASAIAIGLSSLAMVLFQETFPVFSPKIISQFNTNFIKFNTDSFFIASEIRACSRAV